MYNLKNKTNQIIRDSELKSEKLFQGILILCAIRNKMISIND